jgi:hypothetical protein
MYALTYSRKRQELIDELVVAAAAAGYGAEALPEFIASLVKDEPAVVTSSSAAVVTSSTDTLREELTAIANSGWDFSGTYYPFESREFCTDEGDVIDLTEAQLSPQQRKMLAVIRNRYKRWLWDKEHTR